MNFSVLVAGIRELPTQSKVKSHKDRKLAVSRQYSFIREITRQDAETSLEPQASQSSHRKSSSLNSTQRRRYSTHKHYQCALKKTIVLEVD